MKQTGNTRPDMVVFFPPKVTFNFDIVEVKREEETTYEWSSVELKQNEWEYGNLVSAIIRERYTADNVEAVILNYGDGEPEHEQSYNELQEWRKHAKQLAKEVFG